MFSATNQFALQAHIYPWFHVQADTKFVFLGVNQEAVTQVSLMNSDVVFAMCQKLFDFSICSVWGFHKANITVYIRS